MAKPTQSQLDLIAAAVEAAFTPFAFKCACLGEEPSCLSVLSNDIQVAKMYQVQSIARFIKEYNK